MRKLNKDRTVNVVPLQKEQNECLLQRKINVEQRLMECASDPIPVKQVQQLLGQFRSLPLSSPRKHRRPFPEFHQADSLRRPKRQAKHRTQIQPASATAFFELAPYAEIAERGICCESAKVPFQIHHQYITQINSQ